MRGSSAMKLLAACGAGLLMSTSSVDAQECPVQVQRRKVIHDRREGNDCGSDVNCEFAERDHKRYIELEIFDFNETPYIIATYTLVADECGGTDFEPYSETYEYNGFIDGSNFSEKRFQMDLYMCAPFGEYELEIEIRSFNGVDDDGNPRPMERVAWEIEYGADQYHIWDTINTPLFDTRIGETAADFPYAMIPPPYSGSGPGTIFKWPLPGSEGYYSTIYTGPMPPKHCPNLYPSGVAYEGCFPMQSDWTDPTVGPEGSTNRFDDAEPYRMFDGLGGDLGVDEPGVMTIEKCAGICSGYSYMGLQSAVQCVCGDSFTGDEIPNCGIEDDNKIPEYKYLCSGDSRVLCGTDDAVSIYSLDGAGPTPTTPPTPSGPTPPPTPGSPTPSPSTPAPTTPPTPAEGPTPPATTPAPTTPPTPAEGPTTPPTSAGPTAPPTPAGPTPTGDYELIGCAKDRAGARTLGDGFLEQGTMSAEICFDYCTGLEEEINFFGTENMDECYCATTIASNLNLDAGGCDRECANNGPEICGGRNRLSVYAIGGAVPA